MRGQQADKQRGPPNEEQSELSAWRIFLLRERSSPCALLEALFVFFDALQSEFNALEDIE